METACRIAGLSAMDDNKVAAAFSGLLNRIAGGGLFFYRLNGIKRSLVCDHM